MVDLKRGHFRQLSSPFEVIEFDSNRGKEMCAAVGDVTTLSHHGGALGWHSWDEPMLHDVTAKSMWRSSIALDLDPIGGEGAGPCPAGRWRRSQSCGATFVAVLWQWIPINDT